MVAKKKTAKKRVASKKKEAKPAPKKKAAVASVAKAEEPNAETVAAIEESRAIGGELARIEGRCGSYAVQGGRLVVIADGVKQVTESLGERVRVIIEAC